jgi:hypothetical protein
MMVSSIQNPKSKIPNQLLLTLMLATSAVAGCAPLQFLHPEPPPMPVFLDNPLLIPTSDADFLWDQLVDSVDDFFPIDREDRLKVIGGNVTEGRLESFHITGGTYFEPWRGDSAPGYERLQSTFQSIRRRATVRVTPGQGGYLVEIIVTKELEDLYQPEQATVGGSTLRHDGSVVRTAVRPGSGSATLGWIALGRDIQLEQRLLSDIYGRVAGALPAAPVVKSNVGELPPPE